VQQVKGYFTLSGKALANNSADLVALLSDVYSRPSFDDPERVRELVAQMRARREQAITGNGHMLAMGAAAQGRVPGRNCPMSWGARRYPSSGSAG